MVDGFKLMTWSVTVAVRTADRSSCSLSVLIVRLLLIELMFWLTGCAVVIPAIPRTLPGYGQDYQIVGDNAHGDLSGLLILRSDYAQSPRRIAVFKITKGKAVIPAKKDVRFSYSTLMDIPVYWGTFENASSTYVFPLVPGYVCQEPYSYAAQGPPSAPGWEESSGEATIVLVPATPGQEVAMLREVAAEMSETPQGQRMSDLAARQRVLQYTRLRIEQLQRCRKSATRSLRTRSTR